MSHSEDDRDRLVEEFFAQHRRRVEELPADEVTWVRIRDRHRRESRGSRWASAAGLLAAAAALAVGTYALWPQLAPPEPPVAGPDSGPTSTVTSSPTTDGAPTTAPPTSTEPGPTTATEPAPGPTTAAPPVTGPGPLPALSPDMSLTGVSSATDGTLFAVGLQQGCGALGEECQLLVRSTDGGDAWEAVRALDDLGGALYQVAFADATSGWVWAGEQLWVTRDGGQTFTEVPVAGEAIATVATAGARVVVVSVSDCEHQNGCSEPHVAVSDVTDPDLTDDALPLMGADAPRVGEVTIALGPDAAYVGLRSSDDLGNVERIEFPHLFRVQDGAVETMAQPMDCPGTVRALAADPDTPGSVYVACPIPGTDADVGVVPSDLGGRTWGTAGEGHPAPYGLLHLLATTESLIWVSQDEALTSTDGGLTFVEPPEPLPLTSSALAQLVPGGDGTVHAVPRLAQEPRFWTSSDGGLTWRQVDVRE